MKKLILASVAAIGLFGIAACSDNTDGTTTQSTTPPVEQTAPAPDTTTRDTGTGGSTQQNSDGGAMNSAPATPAPAQ